MFQKIRNNLTTILIALGVGAIGAAAPAIGHGVNHALFAHDAGKLDGKDANDFVKNAGRIHVTVGPAEWHPSGCTEGVGGCPSFQRYPNMTVLETSAGNGTSLNLTPELPTTLYGTPLELTGAEICYDATTDMATLGYVLISAYTHTDGDLSTQNTIVNDSTDRDDNVCRLYDDFDPVTLGRDTGVGLRMDVSWQAGTNAQFSIGRTTLYLRPKN